MDYGLMECGFTVDELAEWLVWSAKWILLLGILIGLFGEKLDRLLNFFLRRRYDNE